MSGRGNSSAKDRIGRVSTLDGFNDPYDHAINLVDATAPENGQALTPSQSEQVGGRKLVRNSTHTSFKGHLARRKYAKWQQERFDSKDGSTVATNEVPTEEEEPATEQREGRRVNHKESANSAAVDFGQPVSPEATQKDAKKKQKHHKRGEKSTEETATDILYENQRGSFFCGIPLYSHSSLLQFDPAPWVTHDYKPSAVNITNAQVPDPSWQWVWKHWYVDMTGDVDEDGWQYSFAFFGNFSWHGTHPWFHSFCRRRRWLRQRIKRAQPGAAKPLPGTMSAAHQLNTDYFTIHSKRDRSPSFIENEPKTARAESYVSYRTEDSANIVPEEINDIASLLKALRLATVDREKIEVIKQFVEKGGEELVYLKERIPGIMQVLVFQNSKRQVLEFLRQTAREAQLHREEHDAEDRPEGEAESRRIDNLLAAVEVADEQIKGLEYWSDRKHIMVTTEHTSSLTDSPLVTIFDKASDNPERPSSDSPAGEIRGIAEKADIGNNRIYETTYRGATLAQTDDGNGKGKGKGKSIARPNTEDENDQEDTDRLPPRLERDQMIIPDNE